MNNRVHTPAVFQSEAAECGAAALCAVLAFYGKYVTLETMRNETEVSRDGCTAGAIMRAAKRNRLACRGFHKETEALKSIKTPCIIHWEFNHFVVFEGIRGNHAYINDPAVGHRKIALSELDRSFTGVVLTFYPEPGFTKTKPPKTFWKSIKKQVKFNRGVIARLILTDLLLVVPSAIIPMLSQVFIDNILLKGEKGLFTGLICFLTGSVTLFIILNIYHSYLLTSFRKKLVTLSAREVILKLFSLPIGFFEQRYAGDIADKVNSNSRAAAFVSDELADILTNLLRTSVNFAIMLFYCPELAVVALLYISASILIAGAFSRRSHSLALEYRMNTGRFVGALCAGIRNNSSVLSCGAEGKYTEKFLGYNAGVLDSEQKLGRLQYIFDSLTDALSLSADALILILGGIMIINGRLTIGSLVAFSAVFGAFIIPLKSLAALTKRAYIARAELRRAEGIINYEVDRETISTDCAKLSGKIEVRNLSFKYRGCEKTILSDISFSVGCGSSVAVVGASGSGKTTLLKLLCGLYSPTEGCVMYDDSDIKNISKLARSVSVSVVGQGSQLFSGTIRENITLFDNSVTENNIIQAAKDACIHDFIVGKAEGYNFMLSENGANLSGGQRRRVNIARALISNPTILIMDEATSSVDPVTEKKILDNIKRRGCTVIAAAHRLSAICGCDKIIVLKDGHIEETGTHSELIESDGYYKQIIE